MASEGLITCCFGAIIGRRLAFCGDLKLRRLREHCELCCCVWLIENIYGIGQSRGSEHWGW